MSFFRFRVTYSILYVYVYICILRQNVRFSYPLYPTTRFCYIAICTGIKNHFNVAHAAKISYVYLAGLTKINACIFFFLKNIYRIFLCMYFVRVCIKID